MHAKGRDNGIPGAETYKRDLEQQEGSHGRENKS